MMMSHMKVITATNKPLRVIRARITIDVAFSTNMPTRKAFVKQEVRLRD